MAADSLLPGNARSLEQLAAQALADIERVPVPLRILYNPDKCPSHLLPYLAWAFSVDRWNTSWSDAIKRQVIKSAYFVHSRKGTIGALRRVTEPLGYRIQVTEWWKAVPQAVPGTFKLDVEVMNAGITEETYEWLDALISDAKPVSRHLSALNLIGTVAGAWPIATVMQDGHETVVYPYAPGPIECPVPIYFTVAVYDGDTTTIYPQASAPIESAFMLHFASMIEIVDSAAVYPEIRSEHG